MQRRMAGRFFVVPYEVFDTLWELDKSARDVYLSILRFHFIDEDWDTETEWVRGNIRTTKADIWRLAGVGKGNFFQRTWPRLVEAGLVSDNEDGTISIEKYKKKIDEGISPAKIRELSQKVERLENAILAMSEFQKRTNESSQRTDQSSFDDFVSFKGPRKKDHSLSGLNIVSGFYTGIGQRKLSKKKRERGLKIYEKLIQEGFAPEEIQFAVDWTIKNAKEDLYDFSIIEHTIGQAMATLERERRKQMDRKRREREAAEKERQEDEEQAERRRMLEYKERMDPEERKQLRREAEEEIRKTGQYKDEFIDDFVIEIRENIILRKRLAEENDIEN